MIPVFIRKEFLHVFLAVYLLWSFAEVFYKASRGKGGIPFYLMPAWYGIIFYAVVDHIRLRWSLFFSDPGILSYAAIIIFIMASALRLTAVRRLREYDGEDTPLSAGPYGLIRYPVYTGYLAQLLAIGLMFGSWGALLLTVIAAGALVHIASGQDDARQAERYGAAFGVYRRRTARIIPSIW